MTDSTGQSAQDVLTDLSPVSLARAVRENLNETNRNLRHSAATESLEAGGLFRWRTPVEHPWYNGVICAGPPGPAAGEQARAAVEYFKAHGVAKFTWWPDPRRDSAEWAPHLLPCGFALDSRTPGMAMDLADLPDAATVALEIRRVSDPATLRVWCETFTAGYDVPRSWAEPLFRLHTGLHGVGGPLSAYVGYRDGEPVATSSLFLGAGVAGIYDVATLPSKRGLGFGYAMTLAPLLEARLLGYRAGILQSSQKGLPVYERLGFRTVCQAEHFYRPAGEG